MQRAMATAIGAALLAGILGAAGSEPAPNGKQRVLMFQLDDRQGPAVLGEGLSRDLLLPRDATLVRGCGKLDLGCDRRSLHFDFDGTTLAVQAAPGLKVTGAWLEPRGYRLRVSCTAAPASGAAEVRVELRANGQLRYQDAFDLACRRADHLALATDEGRYAIGTPIRVKADLTALDGGGPVPLGGVGWTLEDAGRWLSVAETEGFEGAHLSPTARLTLLARAPGRGASLRAGTAVAPLPFEVLPDEGWTLQLDGEGCSFDLDGGVSSMRARVSGTTPDGGAVAVAEEGCDFVFTAADGAAHRQSRRPCGSCVEAHGAGTLCVAVHGKSACMRVDASGAKVK